MLALFPFLVTDWNTWALATYSLGVAADLCFFSKICPAVSVSVSSATAPRRGSPYHTTHLLGCFLALTLALSWDKLDAGLLLAVTGPWPAGSGSSLLGR